MYFNEWHGEKLSQKREKPYKKLKLYRHDLRGTLNSSILSDDFFVFAGFYSKNQLTFFNNFFCPAGNVCQKFLLLFLEGVI